MDLIPEGSVIYAKWNDELVKIKFKKELKAMDQNLSNLLLVLWFCILASLCSSLIPECPITSSGVCTPGVEETIVITETESIEYEADGHTVTTTTTTDTTTVTITTEDSVIYLTVIMVLFYPDMKAIWIQTGRVKVHKHAIWKQLLRIRHR